MTACKNFAKGGKAGRVITAALVATLSVGAPVVALATTGAEGGIDMLAEAAELFENFDVTYVSGEPGQSYTYTGKGQGLVPDTAEYETGDFEYDVVKAKASYAVEDIDHVFYTYVKVDSMSSASITSNIGTISGVSYKNAKGDTVTLKGTSVGANLPSNPGTYAVVVGYLDTADGSGTNTWKYIKIADTFTITSSTLDNAVLFENGDQKDTEFNYALDGSNDVDDVIGRMGVAVDGVELKDTDYSITIKDAAGNDVSSPTELAVGKSYIAVIEGANDYANSTKTVNFTYKALDLSKADIEGKVLTSSANLKTQSKQDYGNLIESFDGVQSADLENTVLDGDTGPGAVVLTLVKDPDGLSYVQTTPKTGAYVYKMTVADPDATKQLTGEATFTVYYGTVAPTISYDGIPATTPIAIDLSDADGTRFDASKFTVTYDKTDGSAQTVTLKPSQYTVTYENEKGEAVTAETINSVPGTYSVTVSVAGEFGDDYVAGTKTYTFKTTRNVAQETDVFMLDKDGKNVETTATPTYNGKDLLSDYTFKVVCADETLVEGTDYTLTVTDSAGQEVDEIVDVDDYTVTIEGITYDGTAVFYINVQKLTLTNAYVNNFDITPSTDNQYGFFRYTGEEIVPTFVFEDGRGNEYEVASDQFDVKFIGHDNGDDEVKDAQLYTATLTTNRKCQNFSFFEDELDVVFNVTDLKIYADVASDAWYAQAVYSAQGLDYMGGYSGTKFFGPSDRLTRAQAVITIYNMAGNGKIGSEFDDSFNENSGYDTGFNDVDGHMYYAQAIAWAKNSGIVKGYGDGNFGPDDQITRAQFATMLANYAKLKGEYEAVDTKSVLAGYADGAAVEDWAADDVAWAADKGIIGNGSDLMTSSLIERAQAAAMAVRMQPEAIRNETIA